MNSYSRMILSAMGCLAGAAALTLRSSETFDRPADVLSGVSRAHALYNDALMNLVAELRAEWEQDGEGVPELKMYVNDTNWIQQGKDGSISWEHAASLASFVELCHPQHILEIGSFLGLSANMFLRMTADWGGQLTSVDPNVRHRIFDSPRRIFQRLNQPFQDRLHTIDAFWRTKMSVESGHWDYANNPPFLDNDTIQAIYDQSTTITAKDFNNGQTFDMAFIDGAHDHDPVKADFMSVLPLLQPNSCIVFNNIDKVGWPGAQQAFMEIYREAMEAEQGLALFGDGTAVFIDRGFIQSRKPILDREFSDHTLH